jgi:hypothetical protein
MSRCGPFAGEMASAVLESAWKAMRINGDFRALNEMVDDVERKARARG